MEEKEFLEEVLARLTTVRDGWEHKSKWNNKLGSDFLSLYIKDYKERLDKVLEAIDQKAIDKMK